MRALAVVGAVAALGVVVPAAASGPTRPAGGVLYGHATKGPLRPVCSATLPCYGPAAYARLGFASKGHAIRWTRADGYGDYRIALPPGRYTVISKVGFGKVDPATVKVMARADTRADLDLDTGIR